MGHPENNTDYLAAELVTGEDGTQKIRCTWPDDPLLAQRLFTELEYRFKVRQIEDATRLRTMHQDLRAREKIAAEAARINGRRR